MRDTPNPPVYPHDAGVVEIIPGLGLYVSIDQHLDVETLIISDKTFGSIPSFSPKERPSETAIISIARARLLHILAVCPDPYVPQ